MASFTLASTPGPGDTITCSINDQVNFTGHPDPVPRYLHLQQPAAHPKADQGAGSGPGSKPGSGKRQYPREDKVMAGPTLYERLGGIFAIAAVVDNF